MSNPAEKPRRTGSANPLPGAPAVKGPRIAADQPIYDAVFAAVMQRRLMPGTKLVEAALCETFGVSRTIVRQALHRLAQAQVVELTPNRGAAVASPSREETRELFIARRAIEGAILPLAIARCDRETVARLRERIAAEDEALNAGDHARWVRLAGDFHLIIAELAGNRVLLQILTELLSRCALILAFYEAPGDVHCEHEEHAALVDRIEAGDVPAAIALMDQHLRTLEARLHIPVRPATSDLRRILRRPKS